MSEKKDRFHSTSISLPKEPGTYLCRIEIIRELEYSRVSYDSGECDFEMPNDLPEGATVIGYRKLESKTD